MRTFFGFETVQNGGKEMRSPNVKINRPNHPTYYWLRNKNIVIIDPGYQHGDIHIYQHTKTLPATDLKSFLETTLENTEWEFYVDIYKIGERITHEVIIYNPKLFKNENTGKIEVLDDPNESKQEIERE